MAKSNGDANRNSLFNADVDSTLLGAAGATAGVGMVSVPIARTLRDTEQIAKYTPKFVGKASDKIVNSKAFNHGAKIAALGAVAYGAYRGYKASPSQTGDPESSPLLTGAAMGVTGGIAGGALLGTIGAMAKKL